VIVLLGIGGPTVVGAWHGSTASPPGHATPTPALISNELAWDGLDYNKTCTGCIPADVQVASSPAYVFEVVNGSYEIWTPTGTFLTSNTLDALFGAGTDTLVDPQIRFDATDLRWFASVDDHRSNQILYGASQSSDPTSGWNLQHFNIAGGNIPEQSLLAVNAINVVVTTNVFSHSSGAFVGAQVWVANKSQLTSGGGVATWSSTPNAAEVALVPAQPMILSKTMYLVSDGNGNSTPFDLFALTGSPPAIPTLSVPTVFPFASSAPANATQAGSAKLLNVGGGRVQSAVWRPGALWAVATVGCKPSGDPIVRSCLHLWDLIAGNSTMSQSFNWTTGTGTYDFDPALSTNATGELTVVFGESSASIDPSILVTGQTGADPPGTLEPPVLLKTGTGPDAPGSYCAGTVCPFGARFGATFEPFSGNRFWLVGEYTGSDSSSDFWHTWVASVGNTVTYSITFSETGLPPLTNWSVTLNGNTESSNASAISFLEPNGLYSFSVLTPVTVGPGTRYVAAPALGSFGVSNQSTSKTIDFAKQYQVSTAVFPAGAGTVSPPGNWFAAGSVVSFGAVANASFSFSSWRGSGFGCYNGSSNPASLLLEGPITEEATFNQSITYAVTFTASGLASDLLWSVTLNGLNEGSSGSNLTFNETNGTYTYTLATPIGGGPGTQYAADADGGSFSVLGNSVSIPVPFTTDYRLTTDYLPAGSGSVSPSSDWFSAGTVVNVTALPASGYDFASWSGTGVGSYSGGADPAGVTVDGPIAEIANFQSVVTSTFSLDFGVSPAGRGIIAFDGQNYSNGQSVRISAGMYPLSQAPATGWGFVTWLSAGGVTIGQGGLTVTGSGSINASYVAIDRVSIRTTPSACGSISLAGNVYANGASISIAQGTYGVSASACGSSVLESLVGLGGVTVSGNQVVVAGNGSVVATFVAAATASGTASGISAPVPLWVLLLVAGLFGVVLAVLVLRKRRQTSPEPVPMGVVAQSPPGAGGGLDSAVQSPLPPWSEDAEASQAVRPGPPS